MTLQTRALLYLLLGVSVLGLGVVGYNHWQEYKALKASNEQYERTGQATQTISVAGTTAQAEGDAAVEKTYERHVTYVKQYEELKNENPDVAAFDKYVVPDVLRKIQCERRARRDGLDSSASGCGRFNEGASAARTVPAS